MAAEVSKFCSPPSVEIWLQHAKGPVALLTSGGGGLWETTPETSYTREPYIYYACLADLS